MTRLRVPNWVWAVLVAVHAIALGWALSKDRWDFPDSDRYLQAALNLKIYGELYARPWPKDPPRGQAIQEFTIRPLGYPLAVLGLGGATQGPGLLLLFQNLLSLLNIGAVLGWWARWGKPRAKNWAWAVVGVLSFPAQFIYANAVMSEIILQTAVLLLAGAAWLFIRTYKARYFAGVAAAAIIAFLLKPVFAPLVIVLASVGVAVALRRKRIGLLLIGIIPLVVAGLYMGWNWQRTGYLHFSSIAEINVLHYNAAGVVRQVSGPAAEEKWVVAVLHEANAQATFAARQQIIQAQAGAVLRAHPWTYARQHVQGMITLLLDPGRFDLSEFLNLGPSAGGGLLAQTRSVGLLRALESLPLTMMGVLAMVLLANGIRLGAAARGFLLLGRGAPFLRSGRWIAVGLVLYVALLTGPLGAARFLVPVWPLLLALGLVGLSGPGAASSSNAKEPAPVREG